MLSLRLKTGPQAEPPASRFPREEMLRLPLLEPPPGTQIVELASGGSGRSPAYLYDQSGALLRGAIEIEALFASLSAQLETAGWTRASDSAALSSSCWTFKHFHGEGTAILLISPWSPEVWHLHLYARVGLPGGCYPLSSASFSPF